MEKLMNLIYDCFYEPPEPTEQRQIIADTHSALCGVLGKSEHRLLLQLIDAKDSIADKVSCDGFAAGFQLAWQLSQELNNYKNERIATHEARWPGARFIFTGEE